MDNVDKLVKYFRSHKELVLETKPDTIYMSIAKIFDVEYIHHGSTRVVFGINEEQVIKIALTTYWKGDVVNLREYQRYMEEVSRRRLFSQTYYVSPDGFYLIAERVIPLKDSDSIIIPKEVLRLVGDSWGFNFGIRRTTGEIVCLDYGGG